MKKWILDKSVFDGLLVISIVIILAVTVTQSIRDYRARDSIDAGMPTMFEDDPGLSQQIQGCARACGDAKMLFQRDKCKTTCLCRGPVYGMLFDYRATDAGSCTEEELRTNETLIVPRE